MVLKNSPEKGGEWGNNAWQPPDLSTNLGSLECAQLAWEKDNRERRWDPLSGTSASTSHKPDFPNPRPGRLASFSIGLRGLWKIYPRKTSVLPESRAMQHLWAVEAKAPLWADEALPQGAWPSEHGASWIHPHNGLGHWVPFCRAQPTYTIALIFTVYLLFSLQILWTKQQPPGFSNLIFAIFSSTLITFH